MALLIFSVNAMIAADCGLVVDCDFVVDSFTQLLHALNNATGNAVSFAKFCRSHDRHRPCLVCGWRQTFTIKGGYTARIRLKSNIPQLFIHLELGPIFNLELPWIL